MTAMPPERIRTFLVILLKHGGGYAPVNLRHAADLVGLLVPPGSRLNGSAATDLERALMAEHRLTRIITAHFEAATGQSLLMLFALSGKTQHQPLRQRRTAAGEVLSVKGETYRQRYEGKLLTELAVIIYRLTYR